MIEISAIDVLKKDEFMDLMKVHKTGISIVLQVTDMMNFKIVAILYGKWLAIDCRLRHMVYC
ncbi:hypothetical protein PAT01_21010 [Pseudoalteromonas atlantica]|uniref:Uncharacterized protein n=1 Tax=Pseudoalteromonas atlantica TaxID=288 RepID=A0ABQ0UEB9_PSEAF|nr:hypothetical protein PAT01_21010 [Pseudoalteromonas atlantica]